MVNVIYIQKQPVIYDEWTRGGSWNIPQAPMQEIMCNTINGYVKRQGVLTRHVTREILIDIVGV